MKPSPCVNCENSNTKHPPCDKWKMWFSIEWRKIRKMFLGDKK